MKKLLAYVLTMLIALSIFSPVYATSSADSSNELRKSIIEPINEYLEARYNSIATLDLQDKLLWGDMAEYCTDDFVAIEKQMLATEVSLYKAVPASLKYNDYTLSTTYSDPVVNGNKALVYVSAICDFSYEASPELDSRFGLIYLFELERDNNGTWVISQRSYPSLFDRAFWKGTSPSVANAATRSNEIKQQLTTYGMKDVTTIPLQDMSSPVGAIGTRSYTGYSTTAKANAASTAIDYVDPISTTPGSNGYDYEYPTGYSQVSLDCTNFVSFCLNYGGGIPEDDTGSTKWKRGIYNWYNVDGFYSYFTSTKSDTTKGFYGTTYYSGTSYPSSTVRSSTEKSDIIQFSSISSSDWTHSAIVTSKNPSNDVYVCMHDAIGFYVEYSLLAFYAAEYPDTAYIRFMKITGYYS